MSFLGRISRMLNRTFGGMPGQTLCARMGRKYGHNCLFCRLIGRAVREPDHCWHEMIDDFQRDQNIALAESE